MHRYMITLPTPQAYIARCGGLEKSYPIAMTVRFACMPRKYSDVHHIYTHASSTHSRYTKHMFVDVDSVCALQVALHFNIFELQIIY